LTESLKNKETNFINRFLEIKTKPIHHCIPPQKSNTE